MLKNGMHMAISCNWLTVTAAKAITYHSKQCTLLNTLNNTEPQTAINILIYATVQINQYGYNASQH